LTDQPEQVSIPLRIAAFVQPPSNWEYKIVIYDGNNVAFRDELNSLGAQGWQLCLQISKFAFAMVREIKPPLQVEEMDE
jgi:hypothetical protein